MARCRYWIMAALDIPTNVTTNSVLPFLAIGMGVDDMFILLRMFQKTAMEEFGGSTSGSDVDSIKIQPLGTVSGHSCLTVTMSEVGRSMTLTSVSNFFAFMLASMVPVCVARNKREGGRGSCLTFSLRSAGSPFPPSARAARWSLPSTTS
jgi:hypothetical protein